MSVQRYDFVEDTMEPADTGTWVAFDDVAHLFERQTLRDYFAGQALAGMLANGFQPTEAFPEQKPDAWGKEPGTYVGAAYRLADAMLAERSK